MVKLIQKSAIALLITLVSCFTFVPLNAQDSRWSQSSADSERISQLELAEAGRAALRENQQIIAQRADLEAQERMAFAAERLASLTIFQVVISLLGTLFLGYTIIQAGKSIRHNSRSIDQNADLLSLTQRHAELQLKAYPTFNKYRVEDFEEVPFVTLEFENKGQTPALDVDMKYLAEYMDPLNFNPQWQELGEQDRMPLVSNVVPGDKLAPRTTLESLTGNQKERFSNHHMGIWVRCDVTYSDVFGNRFRRRFNGIVSGKEGKTKMLSSFGNDEVKIALD